MHEKSSRPHSAQAFLDERFTDALKDLLHHSPRLFGKPTSLWTLDLVAEVCHGKGWTPRRLSGEAIRVALKRLGIRWRRAKHWITSPDPAYAEKKGPRPLIRLAAAHPDWVLGYQDETWWSRLKLPALHAWTADEPLRLRRAGGGPRRPRSPRRWPATACCGTTPTRCCCGLCRAGRSAR